MSGIKLGKKLGVVAVDSGQLVLCDPCYIDSEWVDGVAYGDMVAGFNYDKCCVASMNHTNQINFKMGHEGVAVAFSTAHGDGVYAVHEVLNDANEYAGVIVLFDGDLNA